MCKIRPSGEYIYATKKKNCLIQDDFDIWPTNLIQYTAHPLFVSTLLMKYEPDLNKWRKDMLHMDSSYNSDMTFTIDLETWIKITAHFFFYRKFCLCDVWVKKG